MINAMVANDVDTEQTLTCLHLKMYHPHHHHDPVIFRAINLGRKEEFKAEQTVLFGRDNNFCKFSLLNVRVSRIQFALQFFKPLHSSKMMFEIKNLSKRTMLLVDGIELNYLNKVDLPPKCKIRFGDFQMVAEIEEGESDEKYNICCEASRHPLVQDVSGEVMVGIPESGGTSSTPPPVEVDENDFYTANGLQGRFH